jgi:hypothetical protein
MLLQPFGLIPVLEDGDLTLYGESRPHQPSSSLGCCKKTLFVDYRSFLVWTGERQQMLGP